jgi:hypothetical protein
MGQRLAWGRCDDMMYITPDHTPTPRPFTPRNNIAWGSKLVFKPLIMLIPSTNPAVLLTVFNIST